MAGMAPGLIQQEDGIRLSYPISNNNETEFNYKVPNNAVRESVFDPVEEQRRNLILKEQENKLWQEREVYLANERANKIIKQEEEKLWR